MTMDEAIQEAVMNRAVELAIASFQTDKKVDLTQHVGQAVRDVRQATAAYGRMMSLIKVEISKPSADTFSSGNVAEDVAEMLPKG